MKKVTFFIIGLGLTIGFFLPIFNHIAKAEMNYQTGLYTCHTNNGGNGNYLSGYQNSERTWKTDCVTTVRLDRYATENDIIIECDSTLDASCNYISQREAEDSLGFIAEFLYQKGNLPDDYVLQLSFLISIIIISFMGTLYLMKKII